ncbi:MAG: hypothetical protein QG635_937, partial [Bacteroidota bacterium]|nr:hypothetical protein [Bacteroidota bacterium]
PQKSPFVMTDCIIECDDRKTVTTFMIKEDNLLSENEKFTESGLIENIAQTASARVGYLCNQQNQPFPLGYIGALKNVIINFLPEKDTELRTEIRIEHEVFNANIVTGKVYAGVNLAAECEMKIFLLD